MEGYLNTNLSLPTRNDLRILAELGWNHIKISLHTPNDKHDLISGNKGTFRKVVRNIKLLNAYKKRFNSNLPELEFGPVLCNLNYTYIQDFIKLAARLNVKNVFFQPLIEYKFIDRNYKLNKRQIEFLKQNLRTYEILAAKLKVDINLKDLLMNELIEKSGKRKSKDRIHCYEPWLHMTIWPNETFSACSFPQISERCSLGNKTLKEVWEGVYFEKLRNKVKNGKAPKYCERCIANVVLDNINLKEELKKNV